MSTVVSVNFSCKIVLATVVSVIAIRHTSHPSFVLKTKMNVSRDVHRDLASSRGIGFVVDTDMIDPGIHGTAGISNLVQLDLECVCYVLNMQKYALSKECASRYLRASSKHRIPATVEVVPKQNVNNRVPNVNHRKFLQVVLSRISGGCRKQRCTAYSPDLLFANLARWYQRHRGGVEDEILNVILFCQCSFMAATTSSRTSTTIPPM